MLRMMNVLLVFLSFLVLVDADDFENLKHGRKLSYSEIQNIHLQTHNQLPMTAIFNINGEEVEKKVVKGWELIFNREGIKMWIRSYTVDVVYLYMYGNSSIKISNLYENGTIGVEHIGSIYDELCDDLNCKYFNYQPSGSTFLFELVDLKGWALVAAVSSPNLPEHVGYDYFPVTDLTCTL